jgi:prepilin-type N-terminal cleavage/methylation domain-containing protein
MPAGKPSDGFTLVELLVGLALSVSLAMAVAPLWLSLESVGARAADRTIWLLQERVTTARFERDLRLAGAEGCRFATAGALLEATVSQVVFLQHSADGSEPTMVEWEIAKGSLMRRRGACPALRPSVYAHSGYADNKTMLEAVGAGSRFGYVVNGVVVDAPVVQADLAAVGAVVLHLKFSGVGQAGSEEMTATARVAR